MAKSTKEILNTTLIVFGAVLVVLESTAAGYHLAKNQGFSAITDGILVALWLVVVFLMVLDRFHDQHHELHRHNEAVNRLAEKVLDKISNEDPETKSNADDLVKVMLTTSPDGPPTTDQQLRGIEATYHASTGGTVALSFRRDDDGEILGLDAKFDQSSPEAADAPVAHKVPVVADEAPKKLTKSQQRRINDKKGRGPYTDDELKQQANEKRRAARIAKLHAAAEASAPEKPTLKEKIAAE